MEQAQKEITTNPLQTTTSIELMLGKLASGDKEEIIKSLKDLSGFRFEDEDGKSRVAQSVINILSHPDLEVVEAAIYALGTMSDLDVVIEALKGLLENKPLRTELVALEVIGKTKSKSLMESILPKLTTYSNNEWIKLGAIEALGSLGNDDPKVIEAINSSLNKDYIHSKFVTSEALEALSKLGKDKDQILEDLLAKLKPKQYSYQDHMASSALCNLMNIIPEEKFIEAIDCFIEGAVSSINEDKRRNDDYKITSSTQYLEKLLPKISQNRIDKIFDFLMFKYPFSGNGNFRELSAYLVGIMLDKMSDFKRDEAIEFLFGVISSENVYLAKSSEPLVVRMNGLPNVLGDQIRNFLSREGKEGHCVKTEARNAINKIKHEWLLKKDAKITATMLLKAVIGSASPLDTEKVAKHLIKGAQEQNVEEILDFLMALVLTSKNELKFDTRLWLDSIGDLSQIIPERRMGEVLDFLITEVKAKNVWAIRPIGNFVDNLSKEKANEIIVLLQEDINTSNYYDGGIEVLSKLLDTMPMEAIKASLLRLLEIEGLKRHEIYGYYSSADKLKKFVHNLIKKLPLEEVVKLYNLTDNSNLLNKCICDNEEVDLGFIIDNIAEDKVISLLTSIIEKELKPGSYTVGSKASIEKMLISLERRPKIMVPLLIAVINDNDQNHHYKLRAMGALGDLFNYVPDNFKGVAIEALLSCFHTTFRAESIHEIVKIMGHANEATTNIVIDFFCEKARNGNDKAKNAAIDTIGRLHDKIPTAKIEEVLKLLLDKAKNKATQTAAIKALGKVATQVPPTMMLEVKGLLLKKHKGLELNKALITTMSKFNELIPETLTVICQEICNSNNEVSRLALQTMVKLSAHNLEAKNKLLTLSQADSTPKKVKENIDYAVRRLESESLNAMQYLESEALTKNNLLLTFLLGKKDCKMTITEESEALSSLIGKAESMLNGVLDNSELNQYGGGVGLINLLSKEQMDLLGIADKISLFLSKQVLDADDKGLASIFLSASIYEKLNVHIPDEKFIQVLKVLINHNDRLNYGHFHSETDKYKSLFLQLIDEIPEEKEREVIELLSTSIKAKRGYISNLSLELKSIVKLAKVIPEGVTRDVLLLLRTEVEKYPAQTNSLTHQVMNAIVNSESYRTIIDSDSKSGNKFVRGWVATLKKLMPVLDENIKSTSPAEAKLQMEINPRTIDGYELKNGEGDTIRINVVQLNTFTSIPMNLVPAPQPVTAVYNRPTLVFTGTILSSDISLTQEWFVSPISFVSKMAVLKGHQASNNSFIEHENNRQANINSVQRLI